MIHQTVLTLHRMLADAPADPGPIAVDLLGWWTSDGFYVCASCAGRIMARGCSLPAGSTPTWADGQSGTCVTCFVGALSPMSEDNLTALLYERWLAANLDQQDISKQDAYLEVLDEVRARGIDAGAALLAMAQRKDV